MKSVPYLNSIFVENLKSGILEDGTTSNVSNFSERDMSFYYVSLMSDVTTQNFVIVALLTVISVVFVLPANLSTVIVIISNKELWTPSNIILCINGVTQSIGTLIYLVVRVLWTHALLLLPAHNTYKESVYLLVWGTYAVMVRTGNNSYLMLAIIRYVCICLGPRYRAYRYFKQDVTWKMVTVLSLSIIVPALLWPLVMFLGSDAPGRAFHLHFSPKKGAVFAFQHIARDQEQMMSPILITMICCHVLQFVITLLFSCTIIYLSLVSTTKVATRVLTLEDQVGEQEAPTKKELGSIKDRDTESDESRYNLPKGDCVAKIIPNQTDHPEYHPEYSDNTNDNAKRHHMRKTVEQRKITQINSKKFERINSEGQKTTMEPKVGDHVVNIPVANVLLCISRKDVICTLGLTCQIVSLIVTFILTVFGFKISGKIVNVYEMFRGGYYLEAALIINSVVDPIVCVVFSSSFRDAFKRMVRNSSSIIRRF